MDKLDAQIALAMERNARQPSDAIANELNVSGATVRRRLKKMVDSGELRIEAFRDPTAAGLNICAIIGIGIDHEMHQNVMSTVDSLPEVSWAASTTGRFDGFAFVRLASTEHLYSFLKNKLFKIQGIKNTEEFVFLHIKRNKNPAAI